MNTIAPSMLTPGTNGQVLSTNGSTPTWSAPPVGVNQTWQNFTPTLGTTYTNTTGRPIMVLISANVGYGGTTGGYFMFTMGGISLQVPGTAAHTIQSAFSTIIPAGTTFSFSTSGAVNGWNVWLLQ